MWGRCWSIRIGQQCHRIAQQWPGLQAENEEDLESHPGSLLQWWLPKAEEIGKEEFNYLINNKNNMATKENNNFVTILKYCQCMELLLSHTCRTFDADVLM